MVGQAFRFTRFFLNGAPPVHLTLSAVILVSYILTEPYRGWRFVIAGMLFALLAYSGRRIRYNLIERRQKSLTPTRIYVSLHSLTLVLIPWVQKSWRELSNEGELEIFFRDSYMDAYAGGSASPRAALYHNLRILVLVAYLGLALVAGIHAINEYVTFETIAADAE